MNRESQLVVRLTKAELRAVQDEAATTGLSTSAWVRMRLLEYLRTVQKKEVDDD